jgi:signal peptidase I
VTPTTPIRPPLSEADADAAAQKGGGWLRELRSIAILLLVVLAIHSFVAKPFYIPSESMYPALQTGDRLVVSKYPYGWSYSSISFHLSPRFAGRLWSKLPERGDIVILEHPETRVDYIKRVIGLPGDKIELKGGLLYINDLPVKQEIQPSIEIPVDTNFPGASSIFNSRIRNLPDGRQVVDVPIVRETLPNGVSYDTVDFGPGYDNDIFGPYLVKPGHIFLMGDNRNGSADSRVPTSRKGLGGAVPFDSIGGRAELITFSLDGSASWYNPISWFSSARSGRAGTNLRPDRE